MAYSFQIWFKGCKFRVPASLPDRGSVITRCANWRGGTYLFGAPQNEHVSPPTYLSKGLVRAAARASRVLQGRSPANARAANTRDMDDAQAAAPEVGGARSDARGCARRCARHGARHFTRGDPPLDVTVSAFRNRFAPWFIAKFRSAVPSRNAEPITNDHTLLVQSP